MTWRTLSQSTAYSRTARPLKSTICTWLAMLRWKKTSPGITPMLSLPGTRLSEQPIHSTRGVCCLARRWKKPGFSRSIWAAQARLLAISLSRISLSWSAMSVSSHPVRRIEAIEIAIGIVDHAERSVGHDRCRSEDRERHETRLRPVEMDRRDGDVGKHAQREHDQPRRRLGMVGADPRLVGPRMGDLVEQRD